MDDFPTEASAAGTALAAVAFLAPLVAIVLACLIRSKTLAFFTAIGSAFAIIMMGVVYSLDVQPGEGTLLGCLAFGGGSFALALVMTSVIVGSKAWFGDRLMPKLDDAEPSSPEQS